MSNTSTPTIITQKKPKSMTMGQLKTAVMERHSIQNATSLEGSTREQLMKALTKPPIVKKLIGGGIKAAVNSATKAAAKAAAKAKRNVKKKVDKALYSSSDTGPKAPGVTAGGRTSKSAVIGQRRVADYTKGRRIEGAKAGVGVGAGGAALVNSGYNSGSGNISIENFKNRKQMERGKMRKTIQNIKGTPAEIAKDKKAKKVVTAPRPKRKPKVSQNNKIKTNNLKPEVFISGDVSYDMKNQPKRMGGGKVKGYKKGGSITYRMSGGQVVGHGYD
jgi:hypothetical protein